jgi:hypothetical protein
VGSSLQVSAVANTMTAQNKQTSLHNGESRHPEHAIESVRYLPMPEVEDATSAASGPQTCDRHVASEDADRLMGESGTDRVQPFAPLHSLQSSQPSNNYDSRWSSSTLRTDSPVMSQLRLQDEEQRERSFDDRNHCTLRALDFGGPGTSSQIISARPAFSTQPVHPSDQDALVLYQLAAVQSIDTHEDLSIAVGRKRQREEHGGGLPLRSLS